MKNSPPKTGDTVKDWGLSLVMTSRLMITTCEALNRGFLELLALTWMEDKE